MAYKLTEKQEKLVSRFATLDAKSGDTAGAFRVNGDALEYRAKEGERTIIELVALIVPNGTARYAISNAARLEYANTHMAWGNRVSASWRGEADVQRVLREQGATPIPFNALREAGIEPRTVHIVEKGEAETLTVKVTKEMLTMSWVDAGKKIFHYTDEKGEGHELKEGDTFQRHFVGAVLFEGGAAEGTTRRCFLFDIDRQEVPYGLFNPFIVALPEGSAPKTITEAYDLLKPEAVREAEAAGLDVKRQGEWYFIPQPKDFTPPRQDRGEDRAKLAAELLKAVQEVDRLTNELARVAQDGDSVEKDGALRVGNNRPNTVSRYADLGGGLVVVSGEVEHAGREHHPITLSGWHRAIPNTAAGQSWRISGDVD